MKSTKSTLWLVAGVSLTAALLTGCGSNNVGSINGNKISNKTYIKQLEALTVPIGVNPRTNQPITSPAGFVALSALVDRQIIMDMAKKEGLVPTKDEINEEYNRQAKQNSFADNMKKLNLTPDDVKDTLSYDLAKFKLRTKGIKISDDEVKKIYQANIKERFTEPERVKISVIQSKTKADADKAYSAINKGRSFEDVAMSMSTNAFKAQGGRIPNWVPVQGLGTAIEPLVKKAKLNDPIPPVSVESGPGQSAWLIIKVTDRKAERVVPFNEIKDELKKAIMLSRSTRDLNKEMNPLRITAEVKLDNKAIENQWSDSVKALKDSQK